MSAVPEATLPGLVAELVASRHAGGYRFKVQERALRQFAGHCRREGYPDGSITKEAVDGFLYGGHLRASTIRRNELALRQLAEYARAAGWDACTPAAAAQVRVRHQPPYVLADDEVRRLFAAIDSQPMSSFSNKAMVDPVLFRVLYGAGLRVSEALSLTLADVDTSGGTLRIRDSKNGESRTVPVTGRLAAILEGYIAAAHPAPETSDYVFYSVAAGRSASRPYTCGSAATWPTPASPTSPAALTRTRCATASRSPTCGAGPCRGADLAVMLPYLACYMGHADLRGTQYYLRLTADAYPEVMARAQVRFGYVIPAPPGDEQ